ncbi:MAG: hypothetical protein JWN69_569 [Alphaproteobacteria bacterium]|nr:hypothetical protein [Alphaproteobacteria bacterium]
MSTSATSPTRSMSGSIHVGVGGWDFDPWRGTFYPPGLAKAKQLEHASRRLTAIEINATHYKLQRPELFKRWADTAPDGFRFTVKASRFCTNRRVLAEGEEAIARFCAQGLTELGDKLGPILWQFMGTKRFEPDDFGAFLTLLPKSQDGVALRHAIEPRHDSFKDPAFIAMAREAGVAVVFADSDDYPEIADVTADFTYARLQRSREAAAEGYDSAALDRWAAIAREWAAGKSPAGLAYVAKPAAVQPRDAYIFVIAGAKVRAPAAAEALIARLGSEVAR